MLEAIGELISVKERIRHDVPWDSDRLAYQYAPLLAIAICSGAGIAVAGAFWGIGPPFRFSTWALIMLLLPPITGFFLTYLHDMLQVRLWWRALEVLLQLVLAAGVFSSAGGTPWGLVTGIIAAATSWVVAVNLGSLLLPFRPDRLQRESTRKNLLTLTKSIFTLMAILSLTAGVLSRLEDGSAGWLDRCVTTLGTVICVLAALTLLSWMRQLVERGVWEAEEAVISSSLSMTWWRLSWQTACGAVFIGALLPANLSPLAKISFTSLFTRMNDVLAPFFVHTGRVEKRIPSELGARATSLDESWLRVLLRPANVLLLMVLAGGMVWVIRRFLPLMGVDEERTLREYGRDRGFLRWLWATLISWWRRMTGRLFDVGVGAVFSGKAVGRGRRKGLQRGRGQHSLPSGPKALIRFYYARFLERTAARGWARQREETADEFGRRLAGGLSPEGAEAVADLTDVYESVRYGYDEADLNLVTVFKQCLTVVFRCLRRSGDWKSADFG